MPRPTNHAAIEIACCLGDGAAPSASAMAWLRAQWLRAAGTLVRTSAGCLEWGGARFTNGYGLVSVNRGPVGAHRLAYLLAFRAVPVGMNVCHRCDNPACVSVDHLFLGTQLDNMADKVAKGRHRTARKLSRTQVAEIRRRYTGKRGEQTQMGREFGVSKQVIGYIVNGLSYESEYA